MAQLITGSSKTYTHNTGLSCCFRQWKAKSHCNLLHGYALQVHIDFECYLVDDKNWCVDFGSLKPFKAWLEEMFDHTLVVAEDDPELNILRTLNQMGVCDLRVLEATGCEAFSKLIYDWLSAWLETQPEYSKRVYIERVIVSEHSGNSGFTRRNHE